MSQSTRSQAVRNIAKTDKSRHAENGDTVLESILNSSEQLPELFGANVFNDSVQRQRLPRQMYRSLRRSIEHGEELDPGIADAVANAMKDWALERGATHYTHWFQPMTGLTAEKHDSFLQQMPDGRAILEFSGKELIKGEPDASSFPSGGLRVTFEARGYTAWDPTSPAFVRETPRGATLVIPTAFCSWTGEALDKKTPLLRSCEVLDRQAVRLLNLIGEAAVTRVYPTAGAEQEYFLIDRELYSLRPDLVSCGRTLFGAKPPKGQELEDHYFGAISQRVLSYMMDLERTLWKLGVPLKTRHNEVAPSQFELAPIFEHISVAVDHNMLTMEVMQELAEKHGLACLLHEKPFAGVNGSGKHLNYSLADNLGNNLFDPGATPQDSLKFILFLTAIVRAVDLHQDLLRISIASAGNDHRLGANEAPPAIVSIFVGAQLQAVIDNLVKGDSMEGENAESNIQLGVRSLPPLPRDISDRNRTSPFAFTGNKFEFRALGSNQSTAYPSTVLNTIVAESLDHLSGEIEKRMSGRELREVVQELVREELKAHGRILFGGDNYSDEWREEAARRGLLNLKNTPEALARFADEKNIELFKKYSVLSERETRSRKNIMVDKYVHCVAVEAASTYELAATQVLPAGMEYQRHLAESILAAKAISGSVSDEQREVLEATSIGVDALHKALKQLAAARSEGQGSGAGLELANYWRDQVLPAMLAVRTAADHLETFVDDNLWRIPKYRELLYLR